MTAVKLGTALAGGIAIVAGLLVILFDQTWALGLGEISGALALIGALSAVPRPATPPPPSVAANIGIAASLIVCGLVSALAGARSLGLAFAAAGVAFLAAEQLRLRRTYGRDVLS